MGRGGHSVSSLRKASDEPWEVYLYGKRIDVARFSKSHPGGEKALRIFKDRDATEQFKMYHSPGAHKKLQVMMKNAPDAPAKSTVYGTELGKDFDKMVNDFEAAGLYKPVYSDEVFKLVLTILPALIGARLLHTGMPCLGSFLIGASFYLSGWTSHDYLHHGVFKGSQSKLVGWNNFVGFLLGGWQGFSPSWWRARHNTHHLVTNEAGNDPDIKTSPVLVFIRNTPAIAASLNVAQRWQQYYYVPLMALLDLYWRVESMQYIAARSFKKTWVEWMMLAVHYTVLLWTFQGQMQWLVFASLCRGFMTGIVVFATHYGEDIIEKDHGMTLVEQTALTSRNITGGYVMNLLTGYISLQTEHHLFPMMPTANLEKAQPAVRAFFKKHGLEYRESNLFDCVKINIAALKFSHL